MRLTNEQYYVLIDFLKEEAGAPLIEYALIGSLIAVVAGLFLMAVNKR